MSERSVEIGFDTGGTFTDCVVVDFAARSLKGFKVLSTPSDPSIAIFNALALAVRNGDVMASNTHVVLHATTVATNALIERKGAKVGLITTKGFRDIIELRRETRYDEADLFPEFPAPLVPRYLRLGTTERVGADGAVITALDEADLRAQLRTFQQEGVEAVAISFLHSYVNPSHEKQAAAIAREEFGFDCVSASCEVQPEIREYERTSTATANAYLQKKVRLYIDQLSDGLKQRGFDAPLRIMQSTGGFADPATSARFPVRIVESGPAAGTISAIFHGRRAGYDRLVSFDMGGTTAKIAVLTGSTPPLATELEVARVHRFKAGSGIPLQTPSVALSEIGAGGGSIASIDGVGLMRVGPESAGADPGPVCYGQGGTQPTVTDADLILGYLDPAYFAGGGMQLNTAAATEAIARSLSEPLSLDLVRTAWGIHDIVNQNMASAARLHILEQGEDPSTFTLVAFGGAGPVHAHRIAHALGIREVIYPMNAGVSSAFGLMVAPLTANFVQTYKAKLEDIDWQKFNAIFAGMEERALDAFEEVDKAGTSYTRTVDFRYVGQGFEVSVAIPNQEYAPEFCSQLEDLMRSEYGRLFGRIVHGVSFEIVNLRLAARAGRSEREMDFDHVGVKDGPIRKGVRSVYFDEANGYVEAAVYNRPHLAPELVLDGPAIIEESDTTIVVPPRAKVRIDAYRNVIATLAP
jgi:N-methylhydantoinase A